MTACYLIQSPKIAVLTGCLDSFMELGQHTIYRNKAEYCKLHGYHLEIIRSIRPKYVDPQSHASGFTWSRLEHLLDMIESGLHEWIWTVGADTLVTNMGIRLESIIETALTPNAEATPLPKPWLFPHVGVPQPLMRWKAPPKHPLTGKKHLLICGECFSSPQADSFIMRGSKESADYLRDILSHHAQYKNEPWVEQQVMTDLLVKHAAITYLVPQWMMNSYDYSRWHHLRPEYRRGRDCYGNRGDWKAGDLLIHWPAATLPERMEMLKKYEPRIVR